MKIDDSLMTKFNIVDRFMYRIDGLFDEIKTATQELRESSKANPQEMIEAATNHLEEENKQLKNREYPVKAIVKDDKYFCPKCEYEIIKSDVGFYCKNCGQKISRNVS